MALPSKLFRFKIELSNLEKNRYETLDFRLAQHPSENLEYLLTRVFAYALSFEEGLEISSAGLADPDAPALSIANLHGGYRLWIEIGNPSNRKIHKASKAAGVVQIFTYKNPQVLLTEMAKEDIHRKKEVQIFAIPIAFLERLEKHMEKDNRWNVVFNEGVLTVSDDSFTEECEITTHQAL